MTGEYRFPAPTPADLAREIRKVSEPEVRVGLFNLLGLVNQDGGRDERLGLLRAVRVCQRAA